MKHTKIMSALTEQKKVLESRGYTVAYVALYGSQNYNLDVYTDEYESDIDMKAIIVPTLDDLLTNSKPISTVVDTEWGQCDLKDIRSYFQTLLKANPAYMETLFTDYYVVDEKFNEEFEQIFKLKEKLVFTLRAQMIRAMYGMMCEKEKAMCHPYPTIAHKIEKFGYDGKQVSHIVRLFTLMEDYYSREKSLTESLIPESNVELMNKLKLNEITLEEAKVITKEYMESGKVMKEKVLEEVNEGTLDYSIKDDFLKLSQSIIKNKIIVEVKECL